MKEFLKKFGGLIASGAKKLWSLILEAGIGNCFKAGIFIGTSIVSLVLYIKHLRDRKKIMAMTAKEEEKASSNKAPVEEALSNNMADPIVRKEELKPEYRREVASMIDDRFPKTKKKKSKFTRFVDMDKKRQKKVKSLFEELKSDKKHYDVLVDDAVFEARYANKRFMDSLADSDEDNYELVRIWNSPAWA